MAVSADSPSPPANLSLANRTDQLFFSHLLRHGSNSRAKVAAAIGISRPTASDAVKRLLARRLIREAGTVGTNRGPAAIGYEVNPDAGHSLALSLGATSVRLTCWSLTGSPLFGEERSLVADDPDLHSHPFVELDLLQDALDRLVSAYAAAVTTPCLASAISHADRLRPEDALISFLPESIPVLVDHDINWAAIAELHHGAAAGIDDALLIHLGYRVDAALILGGHLHRGRATMAGELGFFRSSGRTLMQRINEIACPDKPSTGMLDPSAIRSLLAAGAPAARRIVDLVTESIGNACALVDPSLVVMTGPLAEALGPRIIDALPSVLLLPDVEVVVSQLAEGGPHLGAEELAHRAALKSLFPPEGGTDEIARSVL